MIVICDENVAHMAPSGFRIVVPAGEKSKSRACKAWIEDQLFSAGFGRDATITAFGGGMLLDLAGFVAATFCRGVPWTAIPTSLLAMVDASHGGKVGINCEHGKNLIGAFYPPQEVILNFDYLKSLPEDEWKNGEAEIIKCGLIADPTILKDPRSQYSIERAIAIKKDVVAQDPKELGIRRILNFGHTVGHAIEKQFDYQISHGQAVASGMRVACELSGIDWKPFLDHFDSIKLEERLFDLMKLDKKAKGGLPRFVLLEKIGAVKPFDGSYCRFVTKEEILCAFQRVNSKVA
ncbi:MAG: 3-dehydroquinate synthase [Chlamydiales bacterium]|nr:3-dehydroquinate synthase [Chlamydiales bacterium]MCH9635265.1 3-dehydroquinate synthase [Chlamydiales bacterium]